MIVVSHGMATSSRDVGRTLSCAVWPVEGIKLSCSDISKTVGVRGANFSLFIHLTRTQLFYYTTNSLATTGR